MSFVEVNAPAVPARALLVQHPTHHHHRFDRIRRVHFLFGALSRERELQ